jgi:hypothetical protein
VGVMCAEGALLWIADVHPRQGQSLQQPPASAPPTLLPPPSCPAASGHLLSMSGTSAWLTAPHCPPRRFFCTERSTQQRMVAYAQDQPFFFTNYAKAFVDLGQLGWGNSALTRI